MQQPFGSPCSGAAVLACLVTWADGAIAPSFAASQQREGRFRPEQQAQSQSNITAAPQPASSTPSSAAPKLPAQIPTTQQPTAPASSSDPSKSGKAHRATQQSKAAKRGPRSTPAASQQKAPEIHAAPRHFAAASPQGSESDVPSSQQNVDHVGSASEAATAS